MTVTTSASAASVALTRKGRVDFIVNTKTWFLEECLFCVYVYEYCLCPLGTCSNLFVWSLSAPCKSLSDYSPFGVCLSLFFFFLYFILFASIYDNKYTNRRYTTRNGALAKDVASSNNKIDAHAGCWDKTNNMQQFAGWQAFFKNQLCVIHSTRRSASQPAFPSFQHPGDTTL
jgi:hypothetical protein